MKNRFTLAIKPAVIATALLFITAIPAYATTIFVTNTNDSGPGSLRQALSVANDGDTIDATGVSGTITLTSAELQITHNVTISGPGAASLAVNGNATYRVFNNFASNATIPRLTITNGLGNGGGGAGTIMISYTTINGNSLTGTRGGGILTTYGEQLTLLNSAVSNNSTGGGDNGGGGLCLDGAATITDCTISGNSVPSGIGGGGILNFNSGQTLILQNSTLSGNSAPTNDGGAIYNFGRAIVQMGDTLR